MKYKAVIFDLDDTIYDYESLNTKAIQSVTNLAADKYNISGDRFMMAFNRARKDTKDVLGNTGASHNRMLYFQKTAEYLGLRPAECTLGFYECYWGYMLNHMKLNDGAKSLLLFCKDHGLKIGLCSDLTAHVQHRKLQNLGVASYFDAIVTSEEAGVEKPDKAPFSMILNKLRVEAKDVLYIGDSYKKDILGAEAMGMDVLWYKGDDSDSRSIKSLNEAIEKLT